MMPGWPQQAKGELSVQGELQCIQSPTNASPGMISDLRIGRRITIKIRPRCPQRSQMGLRMP
jgi:hypothetical protein